MYLNLFLSSLIGSILAGFGGRFFGVKGTQIMSLSCVAWSAFLSLCAFYEVCLQKATCTLVLLPWIRIDLFNLNWGFYFDSLTACMLVVVTLISTLVHLYSIEYIGKDPHLPRFIAYLSLFTFFMLVLVTGENFLQIFVGWEGVGLCSYLLINFWFTRIQANKAAIKAIVVNRIGDFGLALGIFSLFTCTNSIDYSVAFSLIPGLENQQIFFGQSSWDLVNCIGLLLFVGAIGKSAQVGLHTWLPDAIEGPTPVSALIHAATIVTAGVFLLGRCSGLFEYAETALCFITWVGAITAFFAATTGLVQNDIKRVIAYSTCSQLGYIVFACGLSQYNLGVFHLVNHAFFKALLFLGAGSVIHGLSDEQDLRKIGGLRRLLPFTYAIILVGSLSLIGFPFLTGFYSKDAILESAYASYTGHGHLAYWLGAFGAFFTSFYSIRLIYLCFLGAPNGYRPVIVKAHESPIFISFPLAFLAVPSIFLGYVLKDMFIGIGTDFWGSAIFILPSHGLDAEFLPSSIKLLPVLLSGLGAFIAYLFYVYYSKSLYQRKSSSVGRALYTFLNRKWFFDKVYNEFLNSWILELSYSTTYEATDRSVLEYLGPFGMKNLLEVGSIDIAQASTGGLPILLKSIFFALIWILVLEFVSPYGIEDFPELIVLGLFAQTLGFSFYGRTLRH
jgi:NADH-ubiquinone oxidoreductase chain 5